MESLVLRILSTALEAMVAGTALAGLILVVRKTQMVLGLKDADEPGRFHVTRS